MRNDEIITECVVCGNYINAGAYPPVCSENCRADWDIEVAFHRWAKDKEGRVNGHKIID